MTKSPSIPPEQLAEHERPADRRPEDDPKGRDDPGRNTAQTGRQGNIRQNTENQGYQQDR